MSNVISSTWDFKKIFTQRLPFLTMLYASNRWKEPEKVWTELYTIKTSNRIREDTLQTSGFGLFGSMAENEKVTYDKTVQGPSKSFIHTMYGRGFKMSALQILFDIDGHVKKFVPLLNRAMRISIQQTAMDLWNNAFTTTLTADGLSLCNNSHTTLRSGLTYDNLTTTALSNDGYETACVMLASMKDPDGNPLSLSADTLLTCPTLGPLGWKLHKSPVVADARTIAGGNVAHSDPSYTRDNLNKVLISPFLTSTTTYFVLAPKADREIIWYWAMKPRPSHAIDFDSETAKSKIMYACSLGANDGRGVVGKA
jgi:hypothetical protein